MSRLSYTIRTPAVCSLSDWKGLPDSKSLFKSAPGCGLPIGNLTSQLFSNVYLNELDQYVKRNLGFRHYGRYVDDFYVIDGSRDRLSAAVPLVANFLQSRLHLNLNYRKVKIIPVECGVPFLGAVVSPDGRLPTTQKYSGDPRIGTFIGFFKGFVVHGLL